jgi:hypothetical protein
VALPLPALGFAFIHFWKLPPHRHTTASPVPSNRSRCSSPCRSWRQALVPAAGCALSAIITMHSEQWPSP